MNALLRWPATAANPRAGLVLLLLPTAVVAVDVNILFLAMPALTQSLDVTATQQLWIGDVYGLVVGVLAIGAGALGDRVGRRRLLLIGCAGFLLASVLAAFSPTAAVLIAARVLQGVFGATLMPSTLALIQQLFPDEDDRRRAIGLWATCQFAFASLGPVVGGVLLHFFWWGSVFLLAGPICLLVLVLGPRVLPESPTGDGASRPDLLSAGLLIAAMAGAFTAVKALIPGAATPLPITFGATVVAVGAAALFARRQTRLADPFLDLRLLRTPMILGPVLSLVLVAVVLAGTGFWVTQYLQSAVGLDPLVAAIAFAPMGLAIGAGTFLAPRLAHALGADRTVIGGLVVSLAGALLLLAAAPERPLLPVLGAVSALAFGCGPLFAFGTAQIVSSAPPQAAGRAAALAETGNHLGSALGLAVLGTLAASAYALSARARLAGVDPVPPVDAMAATRAAAPTSADPATVLGALAGAGADVLHVLGMAAAGLLIGCIAVHALTARARARAGAAA